MGKSFKVDGNKQFTVVCETKVLILSIRTRSALMTSWFQTDLSIMCSGVALALPEPSLTKVTE